MKVTEFDFQLPEGLIAQEALQDRTASRLLVLDRASGAIKHSQVSGIGQFLRPGDLLVVNNSKVLPARLLGETEAGISVECFLLKRIKKNTWEALLKPGRKNTVGTKIVCKRNSKELVAEVKEKSDDGKSIIEILGDDAEYLLHQVGHIPLPPYIKRDDNNYDRSRYQTVYAKESGSVAAPTAGLHFTPELIEKLKKGSVEMAEITLHVGYGTFKPIRSETVEDHVVDPEVYEISQKTAEQISRAMQEGRRVIAVGTTTTRTLEGVAKNYNGQIIAGTGLIDLYIYPGFEFRVISGLMTNFHLPKSSLLMLVCAFGGKEHVLEAYQEAVKNSYRFYSYGDAMLLV